MGTTVTIPPQFEVVDRPLDTQMTISMGPQHPSTHGVLRLELVLDGEMVVKATPDISIPGWKSCLNIRSINRA
jgi:hypothetical protein